MTGSNRELGMEWIVGLPAQRRPSSLKTKYWIAWILHQAPARPIECCYGFGCCWHCCYLRWCDGEWNSVAKSHPTPPIRSDWACHLSDYLGDLNHRRPNTNGKCSTFGAAPSAKTLYPVRIQMTIPNPKRTFEFEHVRATLAASYELRFFVCGYFQVPPNKKKNQ